MPSNESVLVTGAAGFIGFHLANRLLQEGLSVVGIDNLNNYYDVNLKKARLHLLEKEPRFQFKKLDIADRGAMRSFFDKNTFETVYHLAAQVGVRYSLQNPAAYVDSNLQGMTHILEGCRYIKVKHLIFASSSSVYGANTKTPFSTNDNVDHPISFYAATKKANELMAHAYAHLYRLPCTGLRFFTVYGPWGRPDMAVFKFTEAIENGDVIDLNGEGKLLRDFTYIDDIIEATIRIGKKIPTPTGVAPYQIYNIGGCHPIEVRQLVELLEKELGKTTGKRFCPVPDGDMLSTCSDTEDLERDIHYRPQIPIEEGVHRFVEWYRNYSKGRP